MQAVNGHAGDTTDGGEDEEKKAFGESFMNTKLMTNSKVRIKQIDRLNEHRFLVAKNGIKIRYSITFFMSYYLKLSKD